jgi:tryptophan-rich sensory protein
LWVEVVACGINFFSANKVAGTLSLPYQVWVTLTTALTIDIWRKNREKTEPVNDELNIWPLDSVI